MNNNGMESMLDIFLFEANGLLEQLDEILLDCEKAGEFSQDSINEIFRIMHTIKGSSAMMGFNSIMTVAHRTEDMFYIIRENGLNSDHNSTVFDAMFKSSDFMKGEVEKIENDQPLEDNIGDLVGELEKLIVILKSGEAPPEAPAPAAEAPAEPLTESSLETNPEDFSKYGDPDFAIRVFFDPEAQMENLRAFMLLKSIQDAGLEPKFFPDDVQTSSDSIDEIINNGFVLTFTSESDIEKAKFPIEESTYVKDYSIYIKPPAPAPAPVEPASTSSAAPAAATAAAAAPITNAAPEQHQKQSLINVNLSKLDTLMDLVGEIVISESMIAALPSHGQVDMDSFSKATRDLAKLTDELQEIVMSIRMVPINGVFQKMNRIVRDMSKKLNKDVELEIIGGDTEIDKTIADSIGDPLMHAVRNAMDHGIEDVNGRAASGKKGGGTVTLSAQNTGGEILIIVKDDGKGMDTSLIYQKAKENGLATKPEEEYSKKEILMFTLQAGFSTKDVATEFSGRGVGMDVVVKNTRKLGGDVTVESTLGEGSMIIFKIPLTLSIVKGMEVKVANSRFTIPINNMRQSFKADDSNVMVDSNNREIVMIRNEYYPVVRLHDIYDIETDCTSIKDGILILVETEDRTYCIFADELLGEHQVVVKPIPPYLNNYNLKDIGVGGCAILGDGSISLILDMPALASNL